MEQPRPNPRDTSGICVGIPAYSRCPELVELLESIYTQTVLPAEITICEDMSPERDSIRAIVDSWRERFAAESCVINYHENDRNLGYDGNLRKVIEVSRSPWVMLMGNDDLLLAECIETARRFIDTHPGVPMISRSFVLFEGRDRKERGTSQLFPEDRVLAAGDSSPALIFRACGFIGGLIVNRDWAAALATDRYDGSLYYQIYLACVAFCEDGIGYISRQIIAARMGNTPLFGSAAAEKTLHVPGSYTPRGRADMWAWVLRMAGDVSALYGVELVEEIKTELEVRQSFHIFEMMAGAGRERLSELRHEFTKLGLFDHPIPRALYVIDIVMGSRARFFFRAARRLRYFADQFRAPLSLRSNRQNLEISQTR